MDWLLILILLVAVYAAIAFVIHRNKLWEEHIVFYGPIIAIRSNRVGIFDRLTRYHSFLRIYGTLGAVMVIVVSIATVALLLLSLYLSIVHSIQVSAVNDVRNILAIPGINQFIPSTFAVWFAFVLTLVVHEFGHAFLARVEGIRVKFFGILYCVIPIGAFVEPDEEDFEKSKGLPKIRMLGAGIMNNIVVGLICFGLLILLLSMVVPSQAPLVKAVYQDYPAAIAGVPPDSVIRSINGIEISTATDVANILNNTRPGDRVILDVEKDAKRASYTLTLSSWPETFGIPSESGFMGVAYYDAPSMKKSFNQIASPIGVIGILGLPIWVFLNPAEYGNFIILLNDSVDSIAWSVPFPYFWFIIQILFWCAWLNLTVGLCNAIPMVPFDGGYIFKEGVERLLEPRGLLKYSGHLVIIVSYLMLLVLVLAFSIPLIKKALGYA
ncbi:MAG: peptidase M50 [Methanomicrobiales archaeon HGW-Methanomicrobiales-1]|nr:MAG: peptidase M50 [Methanomicrobiales archaeon HGW-Methanomicrobiales-1]